MSCVADKVLGLATVVAVVVSAEDLFNFTEVLLDASDGKVEVTKFQETPFVHDFGERVGVG